MTLQVSFDRFAETVKRLLGLEEAYVSNHAIGTIVTAADGDKKIVVASVAAQSVDEASSSLKEQGFAVYHGTWLTPEEVMAPEAGPTPTFIAGVAYKTAGDKAGIWLDAYPSLPTQVSVLRAMYDEFRETGEVDDVTFEEFVEAANPNVVIVAPEQIESFLRQKEQEC